MEVKNRYNLLMTENQTPTERYKNFLDANNKASLLRLPKKEKKKGRKVAKDPTVQVLREKLKQRSEKYHLYATEDNRISVQEGKQKFKDAYIGCSRAIA